MWHRFLPRIKKLQYNWFYGCNIYFSSRKLLHFLASSRLPGAPGQECGGTPARACCFCCCCILVCCLLLLLCTLYLDPHEISYSSFWTGWAEAIPQFAISRADFKMLLIFYLLLLLLVTLLLLSLLLLPSLGAAGSAPKVTSISGQHISPTLELVNF